ncbi:2-hydroxyacid dehydrogenase [Tropicimonas isoalkanivorans]|uniref:D-3-phosphoglycerate dehydrogenase n=1 Tax=Tropicimonas isoalkanivorans TaxID=441112 RepID=A0A1I1HNS3_9RHOB|nr:NAD(P)-dependent oxidoreductase [Tropicimonas isoalkanivorans]SFC25757.1 D-3-phosphoglycerate dehydrogenase [Tropicimonas isoalkanivorans]
MSRCIILQPIAQAGVSILRQAGLEPRVAGPEHSLEARLPALLSEAEVVVTRNLGFRSTWMDMAPRLRVIAVHGTGTNAIDMDHATSLGIQVVNTAGANAPYVAEQVFALLLGLLKKVPQGDAALRRGDYDFRYTASPADLRGHRLGLWGTGHVARHVARIAIAFGMEVHAWSRHPLPEEMRALGVQEAADLDTLCAKADILSLHSSPRADGLVIDARRLALLGANGVLVNTARGALVDEVALASALENGAIAGAAIDTFQHEPPSREAPLVTAPNTILAPHLGGASLGALEATGRTVARVALDALAFEAGAALCNPEVLAHARGRTPTS